MIKKSLIKNTLMVTLALGLTACANTDALETNVTELSNKIDALTSDVTELKTQQQATSEDAKAAKAAAEQATTDAKNANERVNNMVASYKK